MSYRNERRFLIALVALGCIVLGIAPKADRFTWFLENAPIFIGLALLAYLDRWFKFSRLSYRLLCLHAFVLMIGGHWTYAEVPMGHWVRVAFGLSRNHYDRLGHFIQGFVPAIITREVLIRRVSIAPGRWLFFLVVCVCLAFSAVYEFVEWWVALGTGEAADAFLGTQGDVWDTQWDMFLCTIGAILSQVFLSRIHDRSMREVVP